MDTMSTHQRMFLAKLNTLGSGDPEVQVSMYEVGEALGLDRAEAGQMAEALFMGGYAELKTLSGGIGITAMGLDELGVTPPAPEAGTVTESLGTGPVLGKEGLDAVCLVLADLKAAIPEGGLSFERLDEVMTDIKTLEVQLLSPQPKTEVAREVFRSIACAMETKALSGIKSRLDRLVSS